MKATNHNPLSSKSLKPAAGGKERTFSPKSLTLGATVLAVMVSLAATASAQNERVRTLSAPPAGPLVHPIPTAPKKSYTPASFPALPGLQCKLYPEAGSPSAALTVFTDDDGYARFHAVRAKAGDTIARLTLDCTDSAGKAYSYSVDLTSDDTFAPHPVNLANERGTDRPALKGDPLSYSQSELIEANYGLRPDPSDTSAYSRWLAAASLSGRMLEAKRPSSASHTHTVVKGSAAPWTGSALTGAANYISTEADFNVPRAIPNGDEITTKTEVATWNGLGGYGTGSGLIQGGAEVETTGGAALYGTFREYCCGDPDSNGYGGAFIPNPGDEIYSEEWYCDAKGNLKLNGGYGCTFLHDLTTGAVLSCTSAKGSPCWSVKALPLCSVSPKTKNCMTIGRAAEFVVELQGPKFVDFASEVDMSGSAYSSTTGKFSQTVSNDPLVHVLGDFTRTTSHMNVSLGKTNQTYFNVSQFAEVGGTASSGVLAESIGVGPNAHGSNIGDAWILGSHANAEGNFDVYQWQDSTWVKQSGSGTQIAVSPNGDPWLINHLGQVYYWDGSAFELAPGKGCATWIGVGPNGHGSKHGEPWIIGCNGGSAKNSSIYQLQGSSWVKQPGSALKIAVSPEGEPWVINTAGNIYFWNGVSFLPFPGGGCATDIAVGPNSAPLVGSFGDVWITGCHWEGSGYNLYQLQEGVFVQVPGVATQITVSPDLGVPWVVNNSGHIYE